jgi:hypothetical protein
VDKIKNARKRIVFQKGGRLRPYRRISARPHQRKGELANLYTLAGCGREQRVGKLWPEAKLPNKENKNFATMIVSRELADLKRRTTSRQLRISRTFGIFRQENEPIELKKFRISIRISVVIII